MTTVFTLAGAFGDPSQVARMLRGEITAGNTVVPVHYQNWTVDWRGADVLAAVDILDDLLTTTSGDMVVFGHSLGAVVACRWLRIKGPTSTIDPARLKFILMGNSVSRYGGVLFEEAIAAPTNTPYTVTDFKRQYDGWTDWPSTITVPNLTNIDLGQVMAFMWSLLTDLAAQNAINGANFIHPDYNNVGIDDPGNASYTAGNITYVWAPTVPWWLPWSLRYIVEGAYNRPVRMGELPVVRFAEPYTGTDHAGFAAWAREVREYRIERAYDRPIIKLYDGDWVYRGTVANELAGSLNLIVNQTGTIQLRLPIDLDDRRGTWAAFWALDEDARGTSNIHIIVETMGARIGGRMKPRNGVTIVRGDKGDEVIIDFFDDIEEFKFVHTAGNPFLPISLIQQPKAWMLFMQADHALLITLAANLLRLQLTNISVDNILAILDPAKWASGEIWDALGHIWQESQIVVKPRAFGDSIAPLAIVVGSIRTAFLDVAAPILEDSELQLVTRRFLTGDPEPWPGAGTNFRNGTLMVEIVDKSGFRKGTSIGGNLMTGLTRSIASVLSNHVEDSYDLITGETIDERGYRLPGILGSLPEHPYVVYRDGDITGIQTSEFSRSPGGAGRITVGGQSMPGVNELISGAIQYGGDVLGDNISAAISFGVGFTVSVGSLGGAIDSFLNPIYRDSILAHMSVPLLQRVRDQGWGHYLETTSSNVTQAFTAASVMDLRARRRETDPDLSFTLQVANASPWLIGDNGYGHWWHGDRVGGTQKFLMPRVFVRRNRELAIDWGAGKGLALAAKFGDTKPRKDAIAHMAELMAKAMSGLQEIGLW
ncbi:hypothetical protein C5U48_12975 [Mycolicibacter virginiensis]|uniref:Alpha/beta hydrolase n=1 Tax=Mycolicibacter virginiensis TaxID=1795032 RepID=A0A9X7NYB3_9MYCO|nr:PE-PPE domain-containing protein [Mycolicibacter virginiensis]PQM51832.1 hypothetical protein C5U48_12975 [Mycolicibacter virginiensis]